MGGLQSILQYNFNTSLKYKLNTLENMYEYFSHNVYEYYNIQFKKYRKIFDKMADDTCKEFDIDRKSYYKKLDDICSKEFRRFNLELKQYKKFYTPIYIDGKLVLDEYLADIHARLNAYTSSLLYIMTARINSMINYNFINITDIRRYEQDHLL